MSNQSDHKQIERRHLEQLARALPELFDKQWEEGPDPPDFECVVDGNRIGLELTMFHHGKTPNAYLGRKKEFERLGDGCIRELRRVGIEACVTVVAQDSFDPREEREEVCHAFVETVKCYCQVDSRSISLGSMVLPTLLIMKGILRMSIYYGQKQSHWSLVESGVVLHADQSALLESIGRKQRSREGYKDRFRETWLALVADDLGFPSMIACPEEIQPLPDVGFDKVVLMVPFERKAFLLR